MYICQFYLWCKSRELDMGSFGQTAHTKKIDFKASVQTSEVNGINLCLHFPKSIYSFNSGCSEITLMPCYHKNWTIFQQTNTVCFCYVLSQYNVVAIFENENFFKNIQLQIWRHCLSSPVEPNAQYQEFSFHREQQNLTLWS